MYKRFLLFAAIGFCLIISITAFNADDWLANLLAKLDQYRSDYPQEKVHLHLDKPFYSIGEDIWFKAYVVNSENNELSALSKVLYVDLVDEQDSVRKSLTLQINNGLANGDIKLTDSLLTAGGYSIRAYTRWMQNFAKDYIFNKQITIGDARKPSGILADAKFNFSEQGKMATNVSFVTLEDNKPAVNKPVIYTLYNKNKALSTGKAITDANGKINISLPYRDDYNNTDLYLKTTINTAPNTSVNRSFPVHNRNTKTDVQFFPEGGQLVNGIRSKIGFKAVNAYGFGQDVKGYIADQNNQHVAEFAATHAGIGVFALQPVAGKIYTAVIKEPSGVESRYALPATVAEGYVLSVNQSDKDSVVVRISQSASLVKTNPEIALVALQNGVVRYSSKFNIRQPVSSTRISSLKFNTGLVQFTLLSSSALPLAERLIFVNNQDQLKMAINTDKPTYKKREKVDMQLKVTDEDDQPVQGNFSVAVTDLSKVQVDEDDETTILSNLLLTSDLKGYVESPNYYFNNSNPEKVKQLDNLLLTQGWRRFTWKDVKENKPQAIIYKPQNNLSVSGKITTLTGKPIPNGKVTLFGTTPQGHLLIDTTADINGNFSIDSLEFNGTVKFFVKAKNAKGNTGVKITLNPLPKPGFTGLLISQDALTNPPQLINYLKSTQKRFDEIDNGILNKTIMLQEVKINDKRAADKTYVKNSAKLGSGSADHIVRKDKLRKLIRLIDAFYGIAGIEVKGGMVYRIGRSSSIMRYNGVPMQVNVNGQQVDWTVFNTLNPADVEAIEIMTSGPNIAIYGDSGFWGVIEITMKYGPDEDTFKFTDNIGRIAVNGYAVSREFYSPMYDVPDDRHKQADLRSTIFWAPNVVSDANGKALVNYFTADEPGTYRVVVEGLNVDGKLLRRVFNFSVR